MHKPILLSDSGGSAAETVEAWSHGVELNSDYSIRLHLSAGLSKRRNTRVEQTPQYIHPNPITTWALCHGMNTISIWIRSKAPTSKLLDRLFLGVCVHVHTVGTVIASFAPATSSSRRRRRRRDGKMFVQGVVSCVCREWGLGSEVWRDIVWVADVS